MTELNFITPQSMFLVHTPFMTEAVGVKVHWKIVLDVRDTHIEHRYTQVDKIEGNLVSTEEGNDECLDISNIDIINEMDPSAIGIQQVIIDDENTAYVQG